MCGGWNSDAEAKVHGAALICMVECDGGRIVLQRSRVKNAIRLRLDYLDRGIEMSTSCGDPGKAKGIGLEPGKDDKEFRLDRASLYACRSLDKW